MKRTLYVLLMALCVLGSRSMAWAADADTESAVLTQIQLLNQVPQEQLNEKTDPGFSILRKLYDQDGPDFIVLKTLLGRASVRSALNPSVRCVLAGIISQRWDTFTLAGNLWLAGLRSPNPDLRDKARRKLVIFIQPSHIPELIDLLKVPGPNVLAYDILQETTGKTFDPNIKTWRNWWLQTHGQVDLVGHLLKDTRDKLQSRAIASFDQNKFWYIPDGIKDAHLAYAHRSSSEQMIISRWNEWVNTDVKRYVDDWAEAKPIIDRIAHQPDPRVNKFLEKLAADPGYGDYASVVLAWRHSKDSLPIIETAYQQAPTVGRALSRASLGEKAALADLLHTIDQNPNPLSFNIMEDTTRMYAQTLHTVGVIPAEQAFELLCHHTFDFEAAATRRDKKKALKKAAAWLTANAAQLTYDRRREYYTVAAPQ